MSDEGVVLENEKHLREHFKDASKEEVIEEMLSLMNVAAPAIKERDRLRQEVAVLRQFGNKDCTAMADEELENIRRKRG